MRDLTKTESTLLLLLSRVLFSHEAKNLQTTEWIELEKEALAQAVFPLVFSDDFIIPQEIRNITKQQLQASIANNLRIDYNHCYTHELMERNGIPYVILKGYSSARYYPDPIYRPMGDVDILVQEDYFERAREVLEEEGFIGSKENHICHIAYRRDKDHLELHHTPAGVPEGNAGVLVKQYFTDVFETAMEVELNGDTVVVPDDFHHGLILLLHTCHHMTGEGIGLRHICDWAVFANSLDNDRFTEIFKEKLQSIGLWRFAQVLTQLSTIYLGMPEKQWAMENIDYILLQEIMCDVFNGGNFGHKDEDRGQESMIISSRGKRGVGKTSMIKQLFLSLNSIVYLKWPITQSWKFLLPFGWLFYCSRYAVKVVFGKRRGIKVSKVVTEAAKRREIYRQLHLYEV